MEITVDKKITIREGNTTIFLDLDKEETRKMLIDLFNKIKDDLKLVTKEKEYITMPYYYQYPTYPYKIAYNGNDWFVYDANTKGSTASNKNVCSCTDSEIFIGK